MSAGVVREIVLSTLREALDEARATGDLKLNVQPALVLDAPKKEAWGDLATAIAMNLSASERRAPREIAEIIAQRLRSHPQILERIEVMPPGFINLTIKRDLWFRVLAEIEAQGERYGSSTIGEGKRVLLEYVSANPTGPLHMGHGRGAALGGALVNLMLPVVHPRMGTPWTDAEETPLLEPAGFMLFNYGRSTALVTLVLHLMYGAVVGAFAAGL